MVMWSFQYKQYAGPQKQEVKKVDSSTIIWQKIKVRDAENSKYKFSKLTLSSHKFNEGIFQLHNVISSYRLKKFSTSREKRWHLLWAYFFIIKFDFLVQIYLKHFWEPQFWKLLRPAQCSYWNDYKTTSYSLST